jgi:serine/threonine protein kinase
MFSFELARNVEILPNYKLTRFLGQGGFGQVWEAEAPGGLLKAVKIVPIAYGEEGWRGRELDGLQKIRSIRHPYLLSLERIEIVENCLVIVTELAESNLAERFHELRKTGATNIPRPELITYMREAAEVLDLLSEKYGLQHLDVKPENLFLSAGHVKVGDFGLVQPTHSTIRSSSVAITPPYAPPELFEGKVDPTADQYSLAVTYQELSTGTRPFEGSVREIVAALVARRPNIDLVPAVEQPVLLRAYSREPGHRYPSCKAMVEALAKINDDEANPSKTTGRFGRRSTKSEFGWRASRSVPQISPRPNGKSGPRKMFAVTEHSTLVEKTRLGRSTSVRLPLLQDGLETQSNSAKPIDRPEFTTNFVAYLPTSIYAHKLRGFTEAMRAQITSVGSEQVSLKIGKPGGFFVGRSRAFHLDIETETLDEISSLRIVEVKVRCDDRRLPEETLGRRALMLVQVLRAHFMVVEDNSFLQKMKEDEIRAAVLA